MDMLAELSVSAQIIRICLNLGQSIQRQSLRFGGFAFFQFAYCNFLKLNILFIHIKQHVNILSKASKHLEKSNNDVSKKYSFICNIRRQK